MALSEFALGVEAQERFVVREPLRRVYECVFTVLAMEREPVDARLQAEVSDHYGRWLAPLRALPT
jgi:hypothetical protein